MNTFQATTEATKAMLSTSEGRINAIRQNVLRTTLDKKQGIVVSINFKKLLSLFPSLQLTGIPSRTMEVPTALRQAIAFGKANQRFLFAAHKNMSKTYANVHSLVMDAIVDACPTQAMLWQEVGEAKQQAFESEAASILDTAKNRERIYAAI